MAYVYEENDYKDITLNTNRKENITKQISHILFSMLAFYLSSHFLAGRMPMLLSWSVREVVLLSIEISFP